MLFAVAVIVSVKPQESFVGVNFVFYQVSAHGATVLFSVKTNGLQLPVLKVFELRSDDIYLEQAAEL